LFMIPILWLYVSAFVRKESIVKLDIAGSSKRLIRDGM